MFKHIPNFSHPKYWPTWFGLILLRVVSLLPFRLLVFLGYLVGLLSYCMPFSRRKVALKNLAACFPEKSGAELRRLNILHFCYLGQSVLTTAKVWWMSAKTFDRLVDIQGREDYDRALERKRNIILLTPHFMAIEISGLALQRERPMIGVYQYMKNTLVDTIAKEGRTRFSGDGLMFERKDSLRKLLRWLNQGHPMAYSPDQDAGRKGVFVPFFHPLASTTPALAKFIQTTNAVVIPCMTQMKPWGAGYRVILGERVEGLSTGDELDDTAAMNRVIEQVVREFPAQYLWSHKRFKTRPENEQRFYD